MTEYLKNAIYGTVFWGTLALIYLQIKKRFDEWERKKYEKKVEEFLRSKDD